MKLNMFDLANQKDLCLHFGEETLQRNFKQTSEESVLEYDRNHFKRT